MTSCLLTFSFWKSLCNYFCFSQALMFAILNFFIWQACLCDKVLKIYFYFQFLWGPAIEGTICCQCYTERCLSIISEILRFVFRNLTSKKTNLCMMTLILKKILHLVSVLSQDFSVIWVYCQWWHVLFSQWLLLGSFKHYNLFYIVVITVYCNCVV